MKARIYIIMCMLALCGSLHAQREYQLTIEMQNGETVSYPMEKVQDVIYDKGRTFISLYGKQTFTTVVYKNTDIKSISWSEYNGKANASKEVESQETEDTQGNQ